MKDLRKGQLCPVYRSGTEAEKLNYLHTGILPQSWAFSSALLTLHLCGNMYF